MRTTTSADGRPLERFDQTIRRRKALIAVLPQITPTKLFVDRNGAGLGPFQLWLKKRGMLGLRLGI